MGKSVLVAMVRGMVLCLVLRAAVAFAVPPAYEITDLGALAGLPNCRAVAVNEVGQITGWCSVSIVAGSPSHAFIWEDEVLTDFGGLPGFSIHLARAINNQGHVVGRAPQGTLDHAFIWIDGVITDLNDLLPDGSEWELTSAYDINDAGQIVGYGTVDGEIRAFIYDAGVATDLGTLGGGFSVALGVNAVAQVVGWAETADGERQAFLWDSGIMTQLGPFDGNFSIAVDINGNGVVVGSFGTQEGKGESHFPFRWENGVVTELDRGDLGGTGAGAIANSGQIVGNGTRWEAFLYGVALLWENGERYELYDLIPPGSGWQLYLGAATDIADTGHIVGHSYVTPSDGVSHAYLLTPVPAIPTLSEWGLILMVCAFLIAGPTVLLRRRSASADRPLFRGGRPHRFLSSLAWILLAGVYLGYGVSLRAEPAEIPREIVSVSVDSGLVSATGARQTSIPTYEIIDLGTLGGLSSPALPLNAPSIRPIARGAAHWHFSGVWRQTGRADGFSLWHRLRSRLSG